MVRKVWSFLLIFVISISYAALVGSEIPISTANEDQQNPHVIYLPDKKIYFVVWEDWRDITDSDIYGVFMDEDGNICGSEFIVAGGTNDSANQTVPRAAYRPVDDKILVVWQDSRGTTNQGYVYYRTITNIPDSANCATFDPTTLTLGTETPVGFTSINRDTLEGRLKPKVVYNSAKDTFLIAWVEKRSLVKYINVDCLELPGDPNPPNYLTVSYEFSDNLFVGFVELNASNLAIVNGPDILRAQTPDLSGNVITNTRIVSYRFDNTQASLEIEYISSINNVDIACEETSGECIFVVEGNRNKAVLTCECADRDNDGTCVDAIDVNNDGNLESVDSVTNYTFIVDEYPEEINAGPDNLHIFAITYSQYTKNTVLFTRVDNSSSQDSTNPAVETDPISKRFLVVWEDRRDNVQNPKVYGQLLYTTAVRYGDNFIISYQDTDGDGQNDPEIANSRQTNPYVEYDPVNQRFIVVWQDGRNQRVSEENLDIYAQYVDLEGSLRGLNVQITSNNANQLSPSVTYNVNKNEFLAVWKDARNLQTSGSDIYAQRFTLTTPLLEIYDLSGTQKLAPPVVNFGNIEVNTSLSSGFSIKNIGSDTLRVYCINFENNIPEFAFEPVLPPELTDCVNTPDTTFIELEPNQSYPIQIKFSPTSAGTFNNKVVIVSDGGVLKVSIFGGAVENIITSLGINERDNANDGNINLGLVEPGQKKVHMIEVKNTGNVNLTVTFAINGEGYEIFMDYPYYSGVPGNITLSYTFLPGEVKPIHIVFTAPQEPTKDIYTGTLEISTSPYQVALNPINLTSTIARAKIQLDKYSVDFGLVDVNTTATQTITVSNPGNIPLQITDCISDNPDIFRVSCPASVDAGANGTITVSFTPQDVTPYTGQITIKTNAGDVTLSVAGEGAGAKIAVSEQNIDFGYVGVNETVQREILITNAGNKPLTINNISSPGVPFSVSYQGTLPITVQPGATFKLLVSFSPDAEGFFTETITIDNNSFNASSVTITLQGAAANVNVQLPTSVDFGTIPENEQITKKITIKNNSSVNITLQKIDSPAQPFNITSSPVTPYELKPGDSVDILVTFAPTGAGDYTSTLRLVFDFGYAEVSLTGKAVTTAVAAIEINERDGNNDGQINLGIVEVGQSVAHIIEVKNTGNVSLNVSLSISGVGYIFPESPTDTVLYLDLNPGESKPIIVRFEPPYNAEPGTYEGKIDVATSPYSITITPIVLSVTYAKPVPRLDISGIDFGDVDVGTTSEQIVKLYNDGNAQLRVLKCKASLPEVFAIVCPDSVDAGSSQNITIKFTPQEPISYEAVATIQTNVGDLTISLKGGGVGAKIVAIPQIVDFGYVGVGNSVYMELSISNTGNKPLTINKINGPTAPFAINYQGDLPITLQPGTVYTIILIFNPQTTGFFADTITIDNNSFNAPSLQIPLQGAATEINVNLPLEINFGSIRVGEEISKQLTIENTSEASVKLLAIDNPIQPFVITSAPSLPYELKPGEKVTLVIKFAPVEAGDYTGTIRILLDKAEYSVKLLGTGVTDENPQIQINERDGNNDARIDLGLVAPGQTKIHMLEIRNTGNVNLYVNFAINGEGYSLKTNSLELRPGEIKILYIYFNAPEKPSARVYEGILDITTSPKTAQILPVDPPITLTATVAEPELKLSRYAIDFGLVDINSIKTEVITLTNTGNTLLEILSCLSSNPDIFTITCPRSIEPGENSEATVSFKPSDVVDYTGTITISTNRGEITVSVKGQGAGGKIVATPNVLDFGYIGAGTTVQKEVRIFNLGNKPLTINNISLPDEPFTVNFEGELPIVIQPGAEFKLLVTFAPTARGFYTGTIRLNNDSFNDPTLDIPIQGGATDLDIFINSSDVNFGTISENESKSERITIENRTTRTVELLHIDPPADPFKLSTNVQLPYILEPGERLDLIVTFNPVGAGSYTSNLRLIFKDKTYEILLKGQATSTLSPNVLINERDDSNDGSINLGIVELGQSVTHIIEVQNTGNVSLDVYLAISGKGFYFPTQFNEIQVRQTLRLAPGESKPVIIRFEPSDLNLLPGKYTGKLDISTAPYRVNVKPITLEVTFARPVPRLEVSEIVFGNVDVGITSEQIVKLYNDGNAQLRVLKCETSLPEVFTIVCPDSVNAGSSQDITIKFTPQEPIAYNATATIQTNVGDLTISLKGGGVGAKILVTPKTVNFGFVNIGDKKVIEVEIKNEGNSDLIISSITEANTSDPIVVKYTGTLPIKIGPDTSYKFLVEFSPDKEEFFTDTITINNNSYNNPILVLTVQGIGLVQELIITPSSIDFQTVKVGEESSRRIFIRNQSTKTVRLEKIDNPSEPFKVIFQERLPYELKPGEEIGVIVSFVPKEKGNYASAVGFIFDINSQPKVVNLKGSATEESVSSLLAIKYNGIETRFISVREPVLVGSQKIIKITLENTSPDKRVSIVNVVSTDTAFQVMEYTSLIDPGKSGEISILFRPTETKLYTTNIHIEDSEGNVYIVTIQAIGTTVIGADNVTTTKPIRSLVLPRTYIPMDAFVIYAKGTNVKLKFAYDISSYTILKQLNNGEWKELYPNNETGCIINVAYDKTNKILSFTIRDNSLCDYEPADGEVLDPLVIAKKIDSSTIGQSPTTPSITIDTGAAGAAGCNSIGGNAILILVLLLLGRVLFRRAS